MIDLVIHAGTKFALEQWLAARGLGNNVQDTNPASPTFGQYSYGHTVPGLFYYWRHPSGKLEKTAPVYSGQTLVTPGTMYAGYFGILRFNDTILIEEWVRSNTAISVLDGFSGYGGEGITILNPEDVNAKMDAIGMPRHEFVGGCQWSDPNVWWLGPVMKNTERTMDGKVYKSLIDYNVWSVKQYPAGWQLVGDAPPDIAAWVQPTGAHDAYRLNALVTYQGKTWKNTGSDANVWQPGVFGWTVQ